MNLDTYLLTNTCTSWGLYFWVHHCIFWPVKALEIRLIQPRSQGNFNVVGKFFFNWIVFLWGWLNNAIVILAYKKFGSMVSTSFPGILFCSVIAYFKKDPTLFTLTAFLSLCRSINTVYEKCMKHKKPCRQGFLGIFFASFI